MSCENETKAAEKAAKDYEDLFDKFWAAKHRKTIGGLQRIEGVAKGGGAIAKGEPAGVVEGAAKAAQGNLQEGWAEEDIARLRPRVESAFDAMRTAKAAADACLRGAKAAVRKPVTPPKVPVFTGTITKEWTEGGVHGDTKCNRSGSAMMKIVWTVSQPPDNNEDLLHGVYPAEVTYTATGNYSENCRDSSEASSEKIQLAGDGSKSPVRLQIDLEGPPARPGSKGVCTLVSGPTTLIGADTTTGESTYDDLIRHTHKTTPENRVANVLVDVELHVDYERDTTGRVLIRGSKPFTGGVTHWLSGGTSKGQWTWDLTGDAK